MDNEKGVWRTINGAHVFIKDGETVEDALKRRQGHFFKHKGLSSVAWLDKEGMIPAWLEPHETLNQLYEKAHGLPFDEDWEQVRRKTVFMLNEAGVSSRDEQLAFVEQIRRLWVEHQMEVGEDMAKEFLSKARKSPDSFLEETVTAINQENYDKSIWLPYDSPERAAYTCNCQRCVQAFAIRWVHGYDVQAAPCHRKWDARKHDFARDVQDVRLSDYSRSMKYPDWSLVCFNKNDLETIYASDIAAQMGRTNASTALQYKQINKIVSKAGPGACYIANIKWKGQNNGYHTFVIINDGGKVKFIDPQNGLGAMKYFNNSMIRPGETYITRVDKARLNGHMMKEVLTYGE